MKYKELPPEIPLGQSRDLRGQKFHMLTPLYRCESLTAPNKRRTYWACKCDCGEYCIKRSDHLTTGHIQSCGCLSTYDLTGQKFGKLTALYPIGGHRHNYGDTRKWHCLCDCGNERDVITTLLTRGIVDRCVECARMHDLTGQKFGQLTVLYPTERDKWGSWKWMCKCDCGNEIEVLGGSLVTGNTKSCGCLVSEGEALISKTLREHNITFLTQATFPTCVNPETGRALKFDFYLREYNCCIEFDGIQHFEQNKEWTNGSTFEETQRRDSIKNKWCLDNGVTLKRIPYWRMNEITFETLMDDTFTYKE